MEAIDISRGRRIVSPVEHYWVLHPQQCRTVITWDARGGAGQNGTWYKHHADDAQSPIQFLSRHWNQRDCYVSVNEFYGWRRTDLTRRLCACWIDVDGITDLPGALDALAEAQMPEPSMVVWSGRGMHLYWWLHSATETAMPVWMRIQLALIEALVARFGATTPSAKSSGVDRRARDAPRMMRLVGSVHGGTNRVVTGDIITGARWTLHELADEVLGARASGRARIPARKSSRATRASMAAAKARRGSLDGQVSARHIYRWWWLVYRDLLAVADGQPGRLIPAGYRDIWLHLTAVALSWFTEGAALADEVARHAAIHTDLCVSQSNAYMQPVLERAHRAAAGDVDEWLGRSVDPRYRYSRQRLYETLAPIIPSGLSLRAIIDSETRKGRRRARERRRRAAKGARSRPQATPTQRQKALALSAVGAPAATIAEMIGVSEASVSRWVRHSP